MRYKLACVLLVALHNAKTKSIERAAVSFITEVIPRRALKAFVLVISMTCIAQSPSFGRTCPRSQTRQPRAVLRCKCQQVERPSRCSGPQPSRRAALASLSALCALQTAGEVAQYCLCFTRQIDCHVFVTHCHALDDTGATHAFGIDTLQSIFPDRDPKAAAAAVGSVSRKKLQDAEDSFQSSDLLKRLKEQTTTNSKK